MHTNRRVTPGHTVPASAHHTNRTAAADAAAVSAGDRPGTGRRPRSHRTSKIAASAIVALLVAAGCGGDDDDVSTTTTGDTTSTSVADETTTTTDAAPTSSTTVDGDATTTTAPGTSTPDAEVALVLEPDGVGVADTTSGSITHLVFGTEIETVTDAASIALDGTAEQSTVEECPPGPAETFRYENGLSLVAQDGSFVGWSVGPDGDAALTTAAGIGLGSTVAEVRDVIADVTVEETTLGFEMTAGDLHGVVDGDTDDATVTDLWAGTVCIFR